MTKYRLARAGASVTVTESGFDWGLDLVTVTEPTLARLESVTVTKSGLDWGLDLATVTK